ncbi:hypothetical protein RFN28_18375 [Mesorhizobium sp. VK24D]|uniref:Uncharacterized protein n=1 Tax=Mesorhizobium album TaxID=3072314 RepID=A0ABU4Y3D3_9HYPH|nr:hypothetical protein [Mesorhizobium sp. VK24D]MDX8480414.1 hypothetical protein [Mesorhizobium sp. VK24D]
MRFKSSARNHQQGLARSAGTLFVKAVAALVAGLAILFLVLSTHYQGQPSNPIEITTSSAR